MSLTLPKMPRSSSSSSRASGLTFCLGQRRRKLLEQLLLFLGQALRRHALHGDHQVAVAAARNVRHALAAQAEGRAGLRAFRDLDGFVAIDARDLDLRAERERRERQRHAAVQVVAVALKELMLLDEDDDVEIAGGPPSVPASPSPVRRRRCPVAMPAGILTVSLRCCSIVPLPLQSGHGLLITLPEPRHWPQVRATVKKPCW